MNKYEKERMKLWRQVYVQQLRTLSEGTAKSFANVAVRFFDQKFKIEERGDQ